MKSVGLIPQLRGWSLVTIAAAGMMSAQLQAQTSVLWWDSTPEYGGQAPDSQRKEMSDFLDSWGGGSVFNSTYVSSEVGGTLASHLASNTYDVIVFDATSSTAKFNASDLTAVQGHYSAGKKNLVLDGTLYIRSISYDTGSDFPGYSSSSGRLLVNEIHQIASRGGGIMIGTDHTGYQVDANQILTSVLPTALFSGYTTPSTDGVFYGNQLLGGIAPVAAVDVFNHWDSIESQAVAPTGTFLDILGASRSLYSQVDVADEPGGGTKYSYISTSWAPGSGSTGVTDPTPGGGGAAGAVPEPSTYGLIGAAALLAGAIYRRKRAKA